MITPRPEFSPRTVRPPINTSRWQWGVAAIIGPFIKHRLKARHDARQNRVKSLMAFDRDCNTRESLESFLGPPLYAMEGYAYSTISADGSNVTHPDVVEVYEKDGCLIELGFKDGTLSLVVGAVHPTSWEAVTGAFKTNIS